MHHARRCECTAQLQGGFGSVQLVTCRATGQKYAAKTIELDRVKDKRSFDFFMKEVEVMKNLGECSRGGISLK